MAYPYILLQGFLIIFISTLLRSIFGFGNALIAMPLLVLVIGVKAAAPLEALCGIVIGVAMLNKTWHEIDLKDTFYLLLTSLIKMPIG